MSSDFRVDGNLGVDVAEFIRNIRAARREIQGLQEDIRELNRQLAALQDRTIRVRIDIDGIAELARLQAALNRMSRQSITITVNLDIDGLAAMMVQLALLRAMLNGASGSAEGFGGSMSSAGGGAMSLGTALLGLIPLLAAVGTIAAGVGAGLVGALATAGLGVGAFAAFAIPTFKKVFEAVKEGEEAIAKLPKPLEIAARNVLDLKDRFKELVKELQPTALQVFAEGLNFARSAMEGFFKAAKPAGKAIRDLFAAAAEGMKGDDWTKFFNYLRDNVGWFIRTWGTAIGNFVTGIANMIRAFDPLSKFVSKGLLGMSESFLAWTQTLKDNQQFQQFINFVKTNGPLLLDVLKQFFAVAMQLSAALLPVGIQMMQIATQVMAWIQQFLIANPQVAKFLAILLPLAAIMIPLVSGIMTVVGALAGLSATAMIVIGYVLAVVAIMVVWWNKCETFRNFVKEMWGKIAQFFGDGIKAAKQWIADILPVIVELWNKYGKGIMEYVRGVWEVISSVIKGAMQVIKGIIDVVLGLLTGDWKRVWNGIKSILKGVWTAIKGIVKGGIQMVKGLLRNLITAIKNIFKGVGKLLWNAGKAIVKGLWSGIKSAWGWLVSKFKAQLSDLRSLLPFSPAKKGPFSGKGWTLHSGRAIIRDMAKGISQRKNLLKNALQGTMMDAQASLTPGMNFSTQAKMGGGYLAGVAGATKQVTFHEGAFKIYNPSSETPSESANKTMTRISRFGIFEG